MKTIFLIIDALKSKYLTYDSMPFLFEMSKSCRYIEEVIQHPGFCERSEIFSGLSGFNSGYFTAIGYSPQRNEYKFSFPVVLCKALSHINEEFARKILTKYAILSNKKLKPYNIPYDSIKYFSLTEDGGYQYIGHNDIFDVLAVERKSFKLDFFTSLAKNKRPMTTGILEYTKQCVRKEVYFVPLYLGIIDQMGHKYGNDIESIKPFLKDVDGIVKNLYEIATRNNYAIAVLGDHGMVPITKQVDIESCLCASIFRIHRDYEMFLDSTVARFWFYKDKAKDEIVGLISKSFNNEGGFLFSGDMTHDVPLDLKNADGSYIYGDAIWFANPGVLISPDYFNPPSKKVAGMHGYLITNTEDSTGMFLSYGKGGACKIKSAKLNDICSELCRLLEIPIPNSKWRRVKCIK